VFAAGDPHRPRELQWLGVLARPLLPERAAGGHLLIRDPFPPLASGNWPAALRWLSATGIALGCLWFALLAQTLWHVVGVLEGLPRRFSRDRPAEPALAAPASDPGLLLQPMPPPAAASAVSSAEAPFVPREGGQIREQSELAKPIDWPTPLRYQGAACKGLFVYAITILEGAPGASAVSFATDAKSPGKYAHPGQKVGDWEVLSITDDWSGANPSAWLIHEGEVCRARLTGNPARIPPPPPPPRPRRKRRRR
jgi:hypothetical protein